MADRQEAEQSSPAQSGSGAAPRIVLDTDCLVAAAYAKTSASRRVLEACLREEVIALVSPDLQCEYQYIVSQAVRRCDFDEHWRRFLAQAERVHPTQTPRVVPDDLGDDKVLAAAVAGGADALVTNDRHLLRLDPSGALRIVRPAEFVRLWLER